MSLARYIFRSGQHQRRQSSNQKVSKFSEPQSAQWIHTAAGIKLLLSLNKYKTVSAISSGSANLFNAFDAAQAVCVASGKLPTIAVFVTPLRCVFSQLARRRDSKEELTEKWRSFSRL